VLFTSAISPQVLTFVKFGAPSCANFGETDPDVTRMSRFHIGQDMYTCNA